MTSRERVLSDVDAALTSGGYIGDGEVYVARTKQLAEDTGHSPSTLGNVLGKTAVDGGWKWDVRRYTQGAWTFR